MPFPKDARERQLPAARQRRCGDGALTINADARVLGATVKAGDTIDITADPKRHLYLVPSGKVRVNGVEAGPRDGVAITGEDKVSIPPKTTASWSWSTPASLGPPQSISGVPAPFIQLVLEDWPGGGHGQLRARAIGAFHGMSGRR